LIKKRVAKKIDELGDKEYNKVIERTEEFKKDSSLFTNHILKQNILLQQVLQKKEKADFSKGISLLNSKL